MDEILRVIGAFALLGLLFGIVMTGMAAWDAKIKVDKLAESASDRGIKASVRALVDAEMKIVREEMRVAMGPSAIQAYVEQRIGGVLEDQHELERRIENLGVSLQKLQEETRKTLVAQGLLSAGQTADVQEQIDKLRSEIGGFKDATKSEQLAAVEQKLVAAFNQIRSLYDNIDTLSAGIASTQERLSKIEELQDRTVPRRVEE